MDKRFLLTLIKIWWAGLKVLCRWCAFGIVLFVLWLPAMALTYFLGEFAGYILALVSLVFIVPIVFFLTSRYLLLLGDEKQRSVESKDDVTNITGITGPGMRRKILVSTLITFFIAFLLGPPDLISQYILGLGAAFLCLVMLLILARCKFMKSSPSSMQLVACILVCIISILSIKIW